MKRGMFEDTFSLRMGGGKGGAFGFDFGVEGRGSFDVIDVRASFATFILSKSVLKISSSINDAA